MIAPVALFTYKRPQHTEATLAALARNVLADETDLHIFSDGPRAASDKAPIEEVRKLVRAVSGFKSVRVIERERNWGLANSIISGVTELLDRNESVIVVEDDLISSRQFLAYMNLALCHYRDDPHVFSVTGYTFPDKYLPIPSDYSYDTYASYRCSSWSWGTWPDRWRRIDWEMSYFDAFIGDPVAQDTFNRGGDDLTSLLKMQHEGKIDSWAIRFDHAHYSNAMQAIHPTKSLIRNIGLDNSGTHTGPAPQFFHASLDENWMPRKLCPGDLVDRRISTSCRAVFSPPLWNRVLRRAKSVGREGMSDVRQVAGKIKRRLGL
jgi:hypothetical protein